MKESSMGVIIVRPINGAGGRERVRSRASGVRQSGTGVRRLLTLSCAVFVAIVLATVPEGVAQQAAQQSAGRTAQQPSPEDRRLEAIERQVKALQELVKELRAADGATTRPSDARVASARVS